MVQAQKFIALYHASRHATTRCYLLKRFLLQWTDNEITVMENATGTRVQAYLPAICVC